MPLPRRPLRHPRPRSRRRNPRSPRRSRPRSRPTCPPPSPPTAARGPPPIRSRARGRRTTRCRSRSVKFADAAGLGRRQARRGGAVVPEVVRAGSRELKDDEPVGVDGHGGKAKQWRHACAAAAKLKRRRRRRRAHDVRDRVRAVRRRRQGGPTGKLTGYDVAGDPRVAQEARQVPDPDARRARPTS